MQKFTSLEHAQETYPADNYLILSDEDADAAVTDGVRELVWAFRPEFMENITEIPAPIFEILSEQCERSNDAILTLIENTCGLNDFVREAVLADGRGHFLAHYDGEENKIEINGAIFYLYRTN